MCDRTSCKFVEYEKFTKVLHTHVLRKYVYLPSCTYVFNERFSKMRVQYKNVSNIHNEQYVFAIPFQNSKFFDIQKKIGK